MSDPIRVENDTMGKVDVPKNALYGASTQRAVDNFPVSGYKMPVGFVRAIALVKRAAAAANCELGVLDSEIAELISRAALEIETGKHDEEFPVDVFQTGSATSTHTNVNEVIANRCSQLAGIPLGSKRPAHPNDHVNLGQSSNDVCPTALHISVALAIRDLLVPALESLENELARKAKEWGKIVKIGRTHLMDATPLSLGQEFSGYERQVQKAIAKSGNSENRQDHLPD